MYVLIDSITVITLSYFMIRLWNVAFWLVSVQFLILIHQAQVQSNIWQVGMSMYATAGRLLSSGIMCGNNVGHHVTLPWLM